MQVQQATSERMRQHLTHLERRARIHKNADEKLDKPILLKPWRSWEKPVLPQTIEINATLSAKLSDDLYSFRVIPPNAPELQRQRVMTSTVRFMRLVVKTVAEREGITQTELLSHRRLGRVVMPRHICIYLCREMTGFSLPRIGRFFDRDHTSIMFACEKIATLVKENEAIRDSVESYRAGLAEFSPKFQLDGSPEGSVVLDSGWRLSIPVPA